MPTVKFFACLDFERKSSFCKRLIFSSYWVSVILVKYKNIKRFHSVYGVKQRTGRECCKENITRNMDGGKKVSAYQRDFRSGVPSVCQCRVFENMSRGFRKVFSKKIREWRLINIEHRVGLNGRYCFFCVINERECAFSAYPRIIFD